MRNMCALAALVAIAAFAQRDPSSPQSWHLKGRVVDDSGGPLPGANIYYAGWTGRPPVTDSEGRFDLHTEHPIVVFRKSGFQSAVLWPEDAGDRPLVMRKATESFPTCAEPQPASAVAHYSFQLPPAARVVFLRKGEDEDGYSFDRYGIKSRPAAVQVLHVMGAARLPWLKNAELWNLSSYSERTFLSPVGSVSDARGTTGNGVFWRLLATPNESISYRDADDATAKIYDAFLDSICLASVN